MDTVERTRPGLSTSRAIAHEASAALALLTRVPIASRSDTTGAAAFGLVGGAIGVVAATVTVIASLAGALPAAVLGIAAVAALSGALHLDGLADTADALAAPDQARAESARLDPRAGPAGVAALVFVVALDVALLAQLVELRVATAVAALIVAAAASRGIGAVMPLLARGRVRAGRSGAWFVERTTAAASLVALGTAIVVALVCSALTADARLAFGAIAGLVVTAPIAEWLIRRRGALDGDAIGATVEIAFAAVLLLIVVLERTS